MTGIAHAVSRILGISAAAPGPLDDFWYGRVAGPTSSGICVKAENAMTVSTVFACVRLLAETTGTLPFRIYERTGERTKRLAKNHPLWPVLHERPNPWQTAMEWREMGMVHLCIRGNFYNQVLNSGSRTYLIPLNPDRMKVEQLDNYELRYTYRDRSGQQREIPRNQVFHLKGLSADGITGLSVLDYARNTVGLGIAQETHGASMFKNGGLQTMWISRPQGTKWTKEARQNFRDGWRGVHGGAAAAGNPPIMEDGMELHQLGLNNRDSQWLESRNFQAVEVCRFFRVPPHLVGILDRATFSNIEQQSLEFVLYTLLPWAVRWEQGVNTALIDTEENPDYYSKLVLDGLLRGDQKSRFEGYNIALQGGWLTRNEVRTLEDYDPMKGGDVPMEPLNMQPAGGGPDQNQQRGNQQRQQQQANDDHADTPDETMDRKPAEPSPQLLPVLQDAAKRIAAHEIRGLEKRAHRAKDNAGLWTTWATGFYHRHASYAEKTLTPLCAAYAPQVFPVVLAAEIAALGHSALVAEDAANLLNEWRPTREAAVLGLIKTAFCSTR